LEKDLEKKTGSKMILTMILSGMNHVFKFYSASCDKKYACATLFFAKILVKHSSFNLSKKKFTA